MRENDTRMMDKYCLLFFSAIYANDDDLITLCIVCCCGYFGFFVQLTVFMLIPFGMQLG